VLSLRFPCIHPPIFHVSACTNDSFVIRRKDLEVLDELSPSITEEAASGGASGAKDEDCALLAGTPWIVVVVPCSQTIYVWHPGDYLPLYERNREFVKQVGSHSGTYPSICLTVIKICFVRHCCKCKS
jgi:hypothetical protein